MPDRAVLPFAMAFLANFILGVSSIYWSLFAELPPVVLVGVRIVLSLVVLALVVGYLVWSRKSRLGVLSTRIVALHVAAAVLVAVNWGTFIWASIHGTVLESGLGYLLAPVFLMIVAQLLPQEARSRLEIGCIAVITLSLGILVMVSGGLEHWVYWTIGLTWGGYTLLKKQTPLSPIEGLFIETAALTGILIAVLGLLDTGAHVAHLSGITMHGWLWTAGLVSVAPLVMFAFAARALTAFSMGALQFVLPTTQLAVSYAYFGQLASPATYAAFAVIWLALGVVTFTPTGRR